ncbi:MAG: GNAT family N-acetyltransferase [Flavobacteriia bacterium]|nr:GNAT family N-acetyltransferase [Flavobacteriia bacterium]
MKSTASYYKQDSSERLSFRRLTLNDVELWSRFFENNDREKFLGSVNHNLTNFQKATNWITRQIERYESNEFGQLAIIEKETNSLIGVGGIIPRELDGVIEYEISYSLLPEKWGNGFATEMSKHFKNWAIINNLSDSIISIIHIDNFSSKNVAIKNEMKFVNQTFFMSIPVEIYRFNLID